jgi:hypothetical protein
MVFDSVGGVLHRFGSCFEVIWLFCIWINTIGTYFEVTPSSMHSALEGSTLGGGGGLEWRC